MENEASPRGAAVAVRDAYKKYASKTAVLNGLNMEVPEGAIYGLLGPSGCGKTTLLRCILGRVELDEGTIHVKARRRKNIGYMPQEIALQEDMSLKETLNFYARLYGMDVSGITSTRQDLLDLLELPAQDRTVKTLSGGQQRRLSFAVALVHDPQLLILDEPTVGVDPILRSSLWEHLQKLAGKGKTIVITTHYIEEARQADIVGLMRGGTLLTEDSPDVIMRSRQCSNLEDAFVKLCYEQAGKHGDVVKPVRSEDKSKRGGEQKERHLDREAPWKVSRFMAQFTKNLVWSKRNVPIIGFLLMIPALLGFLVNIIFRTPPYDLPLGVVSDELRHGFSECTKGTLDICTHSNQSMTCAYWNFISNGTVILNEYRSLELAKEAVRHGRIWGVLHFRENYTDSLITRIEQGMVSDYVFNSSTVDIWLDMSNAWISNLLTVNTRNTFIDFVKSMLIACDYSPRLAEIPLKFNDAVFGTNDPVFIHYAIPGILCPFCFYMAMMFTSGAVMMEKHLGFLDRSLSAGMTFMEVVFAHFAMEILVVGVQTAILFIISYDLYENPMEGNYVTVIVLILLLEAMGTAYGFMLAFFFEEETLSTYAGVGSLICLFILEGVIWPFEGMHVVLRKCIWAIPVLPAITSYQSIARKGWSIFHPIVYYGFLQTIFWTVVFGLTAYTIFKMRKIGTN